MNPLLFAQVDHYIQNLYPEEDHALINARQSIVNAGMPEHSISPTQGQFLLFMARLKQARHILEIGTLGGYSSIWLARALPQNGTLHTIELEADFAEVARKSFEVAQMESKVVQHVGPALDILSTLDNEALPRFDMVFIDADKPPYCDYLEWAIRLSKPGTLIIADNVIREGKVLNAPSNDPKVRGVQAFNQKLAADGRLTSTILQTVGIKEYDGMALAVVNKPEAQHLPL